MNKKIHIISFTVPFPANYGGVIDVFNKVKTLHELGWEVVLHCFTYDRAPSKELNKYCAEVHYYKRKMRGANLLSALPFIVVSRKSKALLDRLCLDDCPIIFEGLHACYHAGDERLKNRVKILRAHNIEHEYYWGLYQSEKSPMKRLYFQQESKKLKQFEALILSKMDAVLSISQVEKKYFEARHKQVVLLYPFHHYNHQLGDDKKPYCLYQGNLGVSENQAAIEFLLKVFKDLPHQLIIAGSNAKLTLKKSVQVLENVQLVENPDDEQLNDLVANAQINVMPTFQGTGVKLKLLNALFSGGHCLVNAEMVKGTGLADTVELAETIEEWQSKITTLMIVDFDAKLRAQREQDLAPFENHRLGETLSAFLSSIAKLRRCLTR